MTNNGARESAKSYIPEMPWNQSCAGSVLFEYFGFTSGLDYCNSIEGSNFLDIGRFRRTQFCLREGVLAEGIYGMPDDGKRDLPDASLFASVFLNHSIVLCMSDENQGRALRLLKPCGCFLQQRGRDLLHSSSICQHSGAYRSESRSPARPAPIYYDLARAQYGTSTAANKAGLVFCASALGDAVSPTCIFYDIKAGNNNIGCYGTDNCYGSTETSYGVLSTSDRTLEVAYPARMGWDFATGLGTVNVTNLVKSWP